MDIQTQTMLSSNSNHTDGAATETKISISHLLRGIPSTIVSAQQLEEERRLSMEMKQRKSEVSRLYSERIASIVTVGPSRIPEAYKEPVVKGKASIKLCSDLEMDQLCCHYTEDFTHFAAGGADGIVRLYDSENFNLVRTLSGGKDTQGFTSCVTCIKHKPVQKSEQIDNQLTITYVNGIVKCFDYTTKECRFTINEGRQTYGVAFHPRMHKFITYGDDLKINLYDYETQKKERAFHGSGKFQEHDGHTSRVFAARFNPASNAEFLTGGWDNTVLLWDLRELHATRSISDVNLCGEGLDIDKTGKKVLTCSWRKNDQLQLWDYSNFQLISSIAGDPYNSKLYCGRFLGNDLIACGGGDPSLFRIVDRCNEMTRVTITNLAGNVCHLNIGKPKPVSERIAPPAKEKKSEEETEEIKADLTKAPSVLFAAGGGIYTVDFPK